MKDAYGIFHTLRILILPTLLFVGCQNQNYTEPPAKFKQGESVLIRPDDRNGVVERVRSYEHTYGRYEVMHWDNLGQVHLDDFHEWDLKEGPDK